MATGKPQEFEEWLKNREAQDYDAYDLQQAAPPEDRNAEVARINQRRLAATGQAQLPEPDEAPMPPQDAVQPPQEPTIESILEKNRAMDRARNPAAYQDRSPEQNQALATQREVPKFKPTEEEDGPAPLNGWQVAASAFSKDKTGSLNAYRKMNAEDFKNRVSSSRQNAFLADSQDVNSLSSKNARAERGMELSNIISAAERNGHRDIASMAKEELASLKGKSMAQIYPDRVAKRQTQSTPSGDDYIKNAKTNNMVDVAETNSDSKSGASGTSADARMATAQKGLVESVDKDQMVARHRLNKERTQEALDLLNNPNKIYTEQLHNEINTALAGVVQGTGSVIPVQRAAGIKMGSLEAYLKNKYQELSGKPINSIPVKIREQLKNVLTIYNEIHSRKLNDEVQKKLKRLGVPLAGMGTMKDDILDSYGINKQDLSDNAGPTKMQKPKLIEQKDWDNASEEDKQAAVEHFKGK